MRDKLGSDFYLNLELQRELSCLPVLTKHGYWEIIDLSPFIAKESGVTFPRQL